MPRISLLLPLLLIAACDSATPPADTPSAADPAAQAPAAPAAVPALAPDVVAEVNGEPIRRHEVDILADDMFGSYQASEMTPDARGKLIDSMVSSLALAQQAASELDDDKRREIDAKTRRYRENLLISEYLGSRAEPAPITEAMIREYYQDNLEQFGAGSARRYEMVSTRRPLASDQRRAFLLRFAEISDETSLQRIDEQFREAGFDTRYQAGLADPELLPPRLYQAIAGQTPGRMSEVLFLDDVPHLLLVGEALRQQAKPLAEVRGGIRRTLMAAQVRDLVRDLSEAARRQATIRTQP